MVVLTCHFFTMEHSLSRVNFMPEGVVQLIDWLWLDSPCHIPWKLVRQVLPWTSSQTRRNFLKSNSELFKSPRETSNTRPLRKSVAISERVLPQPSLRRRQQHENVLVPWVRFTRVLPTLRLVNIEGARMSYHSFRVKGSTAFFLAPFLPIFLFFPTAMLAEGAEGRRFYSEWERLTRVLWALERSLGLVFTTVAPLSIPSS